MVLFSRFLPVLGAFLALLMVSQPAFAQGTGEAERGKSEGFPAYDYGPGVSAAGSSFIEGGHEDRALRALGKGARSYHADYRLAQSVGSCLVRKMGEGAGAMVDLSAEEAASYEALGKVLNDKRDGCVHREAIGIPMGLVNAALAEAVVREKAPIVSPMTPELRAEADAFVTGGEERVTFATIGRCLAVEAPGAAAALLGTKAGSSHEAEALAALYAKAPQCGLKQSPDGVPETYQRAMVALGVWGWYAHRAG